MKQTLLSLSFLVFLFLGYKLPIDPIKNSIDFIIDSLSYTKTEVETKYIDKCAVEFKGTIDNDLCNKK